MTTKAVAAIRPWPELPRRFQLRIGIAEIEQVARGCATGYRGPCTELRESPDEKGDDQDNCDKGLATAELQCNEHQLHSNDPRPTQERPKSYKATKGTAVLNLRVSLSGCSSDSPSLGHQIPGDAFAGVALDVCGRGIGPR
jgi:hypothetical protein